MGQPLPGRIVFMGTPPFAAVSLRALLEAGGHPVAVFTQPDKRAGRKRLPRPSAVKKLALEEGLSLRQPSTLKAQGVVEDLAGLEPDVIVVAAYGKILPRAVLDIPPLGCLNVHASLLPRHRGASPIAHAIWKGDRETGISTMRMEEGLDTGPVYFRREIPIPGDATTGTLTPILARLGADLLLATLRGLQAGILEAVPQDDSKATLAPKLTVADGELDFTRPAALLERQVRAFIPWPGAFFTARGARIKVHEARVGQETPVHARPGDVMEGEGLRVACGDGRVLRVIRLQREGRAVLSSADFLRGFSLPPGTNLVSIP